VSWGETHRILSCDRSATDVPAVAGALLEREGELGALLAALDDVHRHGSLVLVEGAPGLGKSCLLSYARAVATTRGFRVLSACGDQLERGFPFEAVRQLLEPTGRAIWLEERVPFVRESWLYQTLANLCRARPALLTLDDAHWVDVDSLRSVAVLLDRLAELPLVALLAVRHGAPDANIEPLAGIVRHPQTMRLRLTPLSKGATAATARARLGPSAGPELGAACHRATNGNPHFLDALVSELASRRVLPGADEVSRIVPVRVSWAILTRIAALEPQARLLARAAAVLGDGAELRDAAAVAGIPEPGADTALRALVGADILRDRARVEFAHPIAREAIYRDLSPHTRSESHVRAARILTGRAEVADEAVVHLLATEPLAERWILRKLRRAAREAAAIGATECATACLRRVLREPLSARERAEMLLELAELEEASDPRKAIERAAEAVALTQRRRPAAARVEACRFQAALLIAAGRRAEAVATIDRTVSGLAAHERDARLLLEADADAIVTIDPNLAGISNASSERSRTELVGNSVVECRALAMLAYRTAQSPGCAARAAKLAERALAGGRLLDDGVESVPLFAAGIVLGAADRSQAAERLFGEIALRAREEGTALAYAQAMLRRGEERLRQGALYEALQDVRAALDIARGEGRVLAIQDSLAALLRILTERGDLQAGEDELRAATSRCEVVDLGLGSRETSRPASQRLRIERGRLRLAQGRPEHALDELLDAARCTPCSPLAFEWRPLAALAYMHTGEGVRALELARGELADATVWGAPRRLGVALVTLGWVESGERGIAHLREGVALLSGTHARLDHAHALVRLGAAVRRAGRPSEARTFLRSGLEIAARCGGLAEADFAEDELASTGIRRRRGAAPSASPELTPSEQRVAQLAAGGMSNPQIANVLRISRKTVEMHLRSVYLKLEIESRNGLGHALQK
jgi:DNA-binding CsgD family transcriptional regulator/tetratricopeptide (TPR) repeat protein